MSQVRSVPGHLAEDGFGGLAGGQALENATPYFAQWGGWHPYFGDRSISVPIELEVRAAPGMQIVASGRRVAESVILPVGRYMDRTLVEGGSPFQLWLLANFDVEGMDWKVLVEEPSRVVGYLDERVGDASLDTVRVVIVPEADVTNLSIDGTVVGSLGTAERVRENPEYLRAFLAHELVHYWFGDLVQSHGEGSRWMAEGFAEYWRSRYEEAIGANPLAWSFRNQMMLSRFGDGDMPTLVAEADGEDEAVYYQKGAHVLHMLERRLDREIFDEVLRRFVERFRGGEATPSDFFAIASWVSGEDLSGFQRQWLERPRGPVLADPAVVVRRVGDGYEAEVRVVQQEPVYRLDLPVVVRTEDGEDHDYVRRVTDREQTFSFELPARPVRVTLDPGGDVFKWYPAHRLPVGFATFREAVLGGAPYRIVTGEDAGEWGPVRGWLVEQLGKDGGSLRRSPARRPTRRGGDPRACGGAPEPLRPTGRNHPGTGRRRTVGPGAGAAGSPARRLRSRPPPGLVSRAASR